MQTVLPEKAKSKCVLLNEKLQEFVTNYQMACSGSLYSGRMLDYANELSFLCKLGNAYMHNPYPFKPEFDQLVDLFELDS